MARIRAALMARGSSLREWSFAQARRQRRDPEAFYSTVRNNVVRWGDRRDRAPEGEEARAALDALRQDLGPEVVLPFPEDRPRRRTPDGQKKH